MSAKKKILIIDDEEDFCFFVSMNLEKTGEFSVLYATNPDKGIELARETMPDLILLDIMMPKKDGFRILEILKEDAKTISIPIVMLTALEDEESRLKASSLYNEGFITKPVTYQTLRGEIDRVLKQNKIQQKKGG